MKKLLITTALFLSILFLVPNVFAIPIVKDSNDNEAIYLGGSNSGILTTQAHQDTYDNIVAIIENWNKNQDPDLQIPSESLNEGGEGKTEGSLLVDPSALFLSLKAGSVSSGEGFYLFYVGGLQLDINNTVTYSGLSHDLSHSRQWDNVPVPEPASMLLLGTGLIGMVAIGRKKFIK